MVGADDREEAMDLFDLSGRVALVTGGNGGIGFGMAEGLATAGAAVIIAGSRSVQEPDGGGSATRARWHGGSGYS
jgi:2-dehydro-3-deoxy-D-gluconate 5-dehydrogenase